MGPPDPTELRTAARLQAKTSDQSRHARCDLHRPTIASSVVVITLVVITLVVITLVVITLVVVGGGVVPSGPSDRTQVTRGRTGDG
jgi:hypothetical protein